MISTASNMYDPLSMISPITVQFKILFQESCNDKKDWDEPLEGSCKSIWQRLVKQLQRVKPLTIPRCYYARTEGEVIASELHGFSDASAKAYGAVVFLRIVTTCASSCRLCLQKHK